MATRLPAAKPRPRTRVAAPRSANVTRSASERFAERARAVRRARLRRMSLLVLGLGLLVGLGSLCYSGPVFAVRKIEVTGVSGTVARSLQAAVEPERGRPLPQVQLRQVRANLPPIRLLRSVTVQRVWPSTLRVRAQVRTAIAALPTTQGFRLVDETGTEFATVRTAPRGVPQVRSAVGASGWPAVQAAVAVVEALPSALRASVTKITARSPVDISFTVGSAQVKWGGPQESARKAEVLAALLPQRARVYDLSAPQTPVVR